MSIFETLSNEVTGFLGLGAVIKLFQTGDYSSLKTIDGVFSVMRPIIPLLLVIEILRTLFTRKFKKGQYLMPFLIYVFNDVTGKFISFGMVALCIGWFSKYALIHTYFTWYWIVYGYIVWEFAHFIYHFLGHKVRLFWCLHSTHHAPEHMNLFVSHAHFFLEAPYADIIRTSICILLGVDPPVLFFIMFIDGFWGSFIHVGEHLIKNARLGFLNNLILTPSHHRVHHAKNPLYMDTNFCNLLNIWDRIFKTYQPEEEGIEIEYGISREINNNNFFDVYFGEFYGLFRDIAKAPGIKNKFLYIFMPPGWSHTGEHKTAKVVRSKFIEENLKY